MSKVTKLIPKGYSWDYGELDIAMDAMDYEHQQRALKSVYEIMEEQQESDLNAQAIV